MIDRKRDFLFMPVPLNPRRSTFECCKLVASRGRIEGGERKPGEKSSSKPIRLLGPPEIRSGWGILRPSGVRWQ
jgi:hypothetical protein